MIITIAENPMELKIVNTQLRGKMDTAKAIWALIFGIPAIVLLIMTLWSLKILGVCLISAIVFLGTLF
jgi:hypothetical protein